MVVWVPSCFNMFNREPRNQSSTVEPPEAKQAFMISQDLAVRVIGEGFPILIVHGWLMSSSVEAQDFEPAFNSKSSTANGYRRIYVDLPGMGASPAGGVKDLDSIFERVSDLVEQQILPSRFVLVGSSCGAYLVRALTYRFADYVDGMCLRVPLVEPDSAKRDVDPFAPVVSDEALLSTLSQRDRKNLGDVLVQMCRS